METRQANISYSRSGNGIGARLILSVPNLKKIGIDTENKAVLVKYDYENNQIIITKDTNEK